MALSCQNIWLHLYLIRRDYDHTSAMSPNPAQASYLALPTKSIAPGRFPVAFPLVACLYRAYILSLVMLSGFFIEVDFCTASSKDMEEYIRFIPKGNWAKNTPVPGAESKVLLLEDDSCLLVPNKAAAAADLPFL